MKSIRNLFNRKNPPKLAAPAADTGISWEAYRKTWKGQLLDIARIPGELCILFGLAGAIYPPALLIAGIGAAEVGLCLMADAKAHKSFAAERKRICAPIQKTVPGV